MKRQEPGLSPDNKPKEESSNDIPDVDKFFEEVARDIEADEEKGELMEVVGAWLDGQKKEAKERLGRIKGIPDYKEEDIDDLFEKISKHFLGEIRFAVSNFDEIKKKISQKRKGIKVDEKSEEVVSMMLWLESCSKLSLFKLLKRKFSGDLSEQDNLALNILGLIEYGGTLGTHDGISHEIELSLFTGASLDDYKGTIDHELTHHVLNLVVPNATIERISSHIKLGNPETRNFAKQMFFSDLMLSINESAAYIIEGRVPPFETYNDKIATVVFKKVYETIKDLSRDMTPQEKDDFFVKLYAKIASLWREDMTVEDVSAIVVRLKNYVE